MTTYDVTQTSIEVKPQAERRRFSSEQKRRILRAYEAGTAQERGALLRREGLYSSHIGRWRAKRDAHELLAQAPNKRGPKARPEQAELSRLERENVTLRKQLAQARALLDLQKKATLLMDLLTLSPGDEGH
jgi:transposase